MKEIKVTVPAMEEIEVTVPTTETDKEVATRGILFCGSGCEHSGGFFC